jgi:hypothetical protein
VSSLEPNSFQSLIKTSKWTHYLHKNTSSVAILNLLSTRECYSSMSIPTARSRFTLWPSKSRGRGIEWSNFVKSPKKWAENTWPIRYRNWSLRLGILWGLQSPNLWLWTLMALNLDGHNVKPPKAKPKVQRKKDHPTTLFPIKTHSCNLMAKILLVFLKVFNEKKSTSS